jgi:hypothetical protein
MGEAGAIGTTGMYMCADTMLVRYAETPDWNTVLDAYYAYDSEPSEAALQIAAQVVRRPWKPLLNCRYAYSAHDVQNGWEPGKYQITANGLTLHLNDHYPGG